MEVEGIALTNDAVIVPDNGVKDEDDGKNGSAQTTIAIDGAGDRWKRPAEHLIEESIKLR